MTMRTTARSVTFRGPFVLKGLDGVQPAGTYTVETDEEAIEASFLAYRRVATLMHVYKAGVTEVFPVDPVELDAALLRDAGRTVVAPALVR